MTVQERVLSESDVANFIEQGIHEIAESVKGARAINALSGGVDSSVVTLMGHRALGDALTTCFIDNGIMREGEPEHIVEIFRALDVPVELIDAKDRFFQALAGLTDPEQKREAITRTFYADVFAERVRDSGATFLLQGTNYTDVEETVAGIKRQHNILEQLGLDTQALYGYRVVEPVLPLRKPSIRLCAKALGLPDEIVNRPPFPGPALAARVIGEVTRERIELVRRATSIVEQELSTSGAFQSLAILHQDQVTGIRSGGRQFGYQIEVRCWDSRDATTGTPTELPFEVLSRLGRRIPEEIPQVVSVTYHIAPKPPATIEAV